MGYIKDITGQRYGKWTVLEFSGRNKSGGAMFLCVCDCGTKRIVDGRSLRTGASKCCGCTRALINKPVHGGRKDRLYQVWHGMKDRCLNPKSKYYHWYGARGITVCDEWKNSYPSFKEWAIKNGYDENAPKYKCTLDRINNDGDYCPENCAWHDQRQQSNNRRTNHCIEYNGETHTLSEWSRLTGIHKSTLLVRICKLGWPVEKALTKPARSKVI